MSMQFTTGSAIAGFATGMRSLMPLSVTLAADRSAWTGLAGTLAAGEVIGDKLPFVPPRTQPIPLIGRVVLGATCGYLIAKRAGRCERSGAALGAAGAVAGTVLSYNARKYLSGDVGIPDPVIALAEDGIALGFARFANA